MREIKLTHGQVTIVDDDMFEELNRHKWHSSWNKCTKSFYARTNIGYGRKNKKIILMHRFVLNDPEKATIDHINKNTLDNRIKNLRVCTQGENNCNRGKQSNNKSGFKGVWWQSDHKMWSAEIKFKTSKQRLGYFHSPEAAASAYNRAALKFHGAFARINALPYDFCADSRDW